MLNPKNFTFIAFTLLLSTFSAIAQTKLADSDVLMKALVDEMNRSVNQLQLKDFGKPYFVEYGIGDEESF